MRNVNPFVIIAVMVFSLNDSSVVSADMTLVKDNTPAASIVVGKNVSADEKYAARELQ